MSEIVGIAEGKIRRIATHALSDPTATAGKYSSSNDLPTEV
jgi:hypothetical protein